MKVEPKILDPKEEVKESGSESEPIEPVEVETPSVEEINRKLEIENAELRGKATAFETISKNVPRGTEPNQADQWKATALSDINVLNEDEFQTKYKYSKLQVNSAILQNDFQNQTTSQNQKFAKIEAENRLAAQHSDFFEYKNEIQEAINDAAPEVKQDPERLSKVMERAYLAATKSNPKKEPTVERKHISSGFEKPSPRKVVNPKEESDEIPEQYSKICKAFKITSEKERQSLMESDDVETHFGNGIVFRDRKKGFETIKS